ncbi:MAG: outer membrane beta-barrel protein [Bdellovibrionia bacterium]
MNTVSPYSYFLIYFGIFLSVFCESIAYPMELMEFLTLGSSAPSIQNNLDSSLKTQSGFSIGGGISLVFRMTEHLDVETTILYLPRNYSKTGGSRLQTSYSLAVLQYPVVTRYWLSENFALGLGAYYSTGLGNLTLTQNSQPQVLGYNDILLTAWDLGLTASAQYLSPLNENMNLIGQARFLFGLTNSDQTENGSLSTRDLQLWFGIGFKL